MRKASNKCYAAAARWWLLLCYADADAMRSLVCAKKKWILRHDHEVMDEILILENRVVKHFAYFMLQS
jgi:hypothetical protein